MSLSNIRTTIQTTLAMGTVVRLHIAAPASSEGLHQAMTTVEQIFRDVERACSRFDADSELSRLCQATPAEFTPVSRPLFETIRFAVEMAKATNGRFDPTVGKTLTRLGFDRHYLTGETFAPPAALEDVSYTDITLDETLAQIRLDKPMLLDLGAVAKGFAVDLAAQSLQAFPDFQGFVIDAGGDIYVSGTNHEGESWLIGIQHPVEKDELISQVQITDAAVCTSGNYIRKSPVVGGAHHILDAQSKQSPDEIISCTVIAPFAMMADAFSTAGLVLGLEEGRAFLNNAELTSLLITRDGDLYSTGEFARYEYA